ncbi:MAG: hypothetical protein K2X93_04060 [Candidatus Obscuribacterales bacterium]|nr:hypothetical protein [Candidatus Obscuribacterales bacterium]
MFEFLFGKKKSASVATPAGAATATATVGNETSATAVSVLEPELPELEKVRNNFTKPHLPRDEAVIKGEIDVLLGQRSDTVSAKDDAVGKVKAEIDETKRLADKAMVDLLPVEAELKASIVAKRDADIKKQQARIQQLERDCAAACQTLDAQIALLNIDNNVRPIDAQFPRIDMSFLEQKRTIPGKSFQMPKFAMFSIDNPKCALSARSTYGHETPASTSTPAIFAKLADLSVLCQYALDQRYRYGYHSLEVKAEATFKGAIPATVRAVLVDAKKTFQQVYLVNEPEWTVDEVAIPFVPPVDPLVIGFRDGIFWLIASFDTTPAEEYIRREFTQGELKDVRG